MVLRDGAWKARRTEVMKHVLTAYVQQQQQQQRRMSATQRPTDDLLNN